MPTPGGTLWVCGDCMMVDATGDEPIDRREGEPETWALEPDGDVTPGLLREEHDDDCDPDDQCDCETREFSWSSCDGCGSALGGSRHAYTYWTD